ncbi:MAG: hypothetical protein QM504_04755 [Pseudomonadota bacterium]
MKKLPAYLALILLAPHVTIASINDIKGAFGLTFGKAVPKDIHCNLSTVHTTSDCYLSPPKPFISFNSYRISAASLGRIYKIYEISGYKKMQNKYQQCIKEAEYIAEKIDKKYALNLIKEPVKSILGNTHQNGTMWRTPNKKHNKSVYIMCHKVTPGLIDESKSYYQLYISYKDSSIYDKAIWEKINNDSKVNLTKIKNSDDSGL